jgi:hypothetical protein
MKAPVTSLALGAIALSLLAAGCGKQETKAPAPAAPAAANAPAAPAAKEMKAAADKMVDQGKAAAGQMSADLSAQAQGMIDKAKTLISEKKYQDAISSLQTLAMSKLSPEHKKTVDDLIAQAQKLMSSDMGKAVQGVMKK